MLKLYYSKGSSSLAAHILLEETGAPYEAEEVSIAKDQHKRAAFLAINPRGRLPVLETPQGTLTENPAILEYIAASFPDANLMPNGAFAQSQARSMCAYLCATVHVALAHSKRGARWADDAGAIAAMGAKAPENLRDCASVLDAHLDGKTWAMGSAYSFVDPYLYLIKGWLSGCDVSIKRYPNLARHAAALGDRPAARKILALYDIT